MLVTVKAAPEVFRKLLCIREIGKVLARKHGLARGRIRMLHRGFLDGFLLRGRDIQGADHQQGTGEQYAP